MVRLWSFDAAILSFPLSKSPSMRLAGGRQIPFRSEEKTPHFVASSKHTGIC